MPTRGVVMLSTMDGFGRGKKCTTVEHLGMDRHASHRYQRLAGPHGVPCTRRADAARGVGWGGRAERHHGAAAAMIGAKAKGLYAKAAKERQRAAGTGCAGRRGGDERMVSDNCREALQGKATEQAATALGVSSRSIERAAKVLKQADPELAKAVATGKVSVSKAAATLKEPVEVQQAVARGFSDSRTELAGDPMSGILCVWTCGQLSMRSWRRVAGPRRNWPGGRG